MIYGARLRQAREIAGYTQSGLAELAGWHQSRLSDAEKDTWPVPDHVLWEIAAHTEFPVEFFSTPPRLQLHEAPLHFRAQARMSARESHRTLRTGEIVGEQALRMRGKVEPPPVLVQRIDASDPVEAAGDARRQVGVSPLAPIPGLPTVLERAGVLLVALPLAAHRRDAFSLWCDDVPLIALLDVDAGDRQAWSVAHELGHLLLHKDQPASRDREREADDFAAAFLTPLEALDTEMPAQPTLQHLALLKQRWGVSIQSLIRRARELGRIDDARYTSLFRQISARGERLRERAGLAPVKPRAFRKMAETLYGPDPAPGLAGDAGWTVEYAVDVLNRHATIAELPRRVMNASNGNVVPMTSRKRRR